MIRELPEQFAQGSCARPGCGEICDGVESDVVVAFSQPVERIQPADSIVSFEQADRLFKVSEADARGQPGQTGTDDDSVVFHAAVRGTGFKTRFVVAGFAKSPMLSA